MDLAVFGEDRSVSVAEQSAAGHINIIKGAVAVQNSIPGKGKFLYSPLVALYRNMLAVNAKGGCIASPCGNWCIHIGLQHNGCLGFSACCNFRQRVVQCIIVGNLVGRFRKGGDGGFLIGRFVQSVRGGDSVFVCAAAGFGGIFFLRRLFLGGRGSSFAACAAAGFGSISFLRRLVLGGRGSGFAVCAAVGFGGAGVGRVGCFAGGFSGWYKRILCRCKGAGGKHGECHCNRQHACRNLFFHFLCFLLILSDCRGGKVRRWWAL